VFLFLINELNPNGATGARRVFDLTVHDDNMSRALGMGAGAKPDGARAQNYSETLNGVYNMANSRLTPNILPQIGVGDSSERALTQSRARHGSLRKNVVA
jgi:hypothetical protein